MDVSVEGSTDERCNVANGTARSSVNPPHWTHSSRGRVRRYLREDEVERMIKAVRQRNRYGTRDAALIRVGYRHGYRISELVDLRWSDIDFAHGRLAVRRRKGSLESVHPLDAFELRALRALQRVAKTDYVFESERGTPMHKRNAQVMIEKAGRAAGLDFHVCAHQLRHGAGYRLANQGATTRDIQVFLGHKNLSNVERYTALAADRFKAF